MIQYKLDEVGPVDNRPSTNYLHPFVYFYFFFKEEKVTGDTWHVGRDMGHVTH